MICRKVDLWFRGLRVGDMSNRDYAGPFGDFGLHAPFCGCNQCEIMRRLDDPLNPCYQHMRQRKKEEEKDKACTQT